MENLHLKNLKDQDIKHFELYIKNQLNNITEPKQTATNIVNQLYKNFENVIYQSLTTNYIDNIIYELKKLLSKKDINKNALITLLIIHYSNFKNDEENQDTNIKLKKTVTLSLYLEALFINILELLIEEHIFNKTFNKEQKRIIQEKLEKFYNTNNEEMYLPTFYSYISTYDFKSTNSIFKNSQNNKEIISKSQYENLTNNLDRLYYLINDNLFYRFNKKYLEKLNFYVEEVISDITLHITNNIDILIKYFYKIEK